MRYILRQEPDDILLERQILRQEPDGILIESKISRQEPDGILLETDFERIIAVRLIDFFETNHEGRYCCY